VPRKLIPLLGGLLLLTVAVMGLLLWAILSGEAGQQRGLVIRNTTSGAITVAFADGQSKRISDACESTCSGTFVIRREDFPQNVTVTDADGAVILERPVSYDELAEAEFRVDVDRSGLFPTQEIRTITP
jgi:hypothetical protein